MKPRLLILLLCTAFTALSQETPNIKFGKIEVADLQKKVYAIDSGANAVVLSDIGSTKIEGNNKGWFSLVYKRHRRIHILNKSAYDRADFAIPLYHEGSQEEELKNLRGTTYNLESGKIVETDLRRENIFKEKLDKNRNIRKFTMPAVKEGSIIEYEYEIQSDYLFNLQDWSFQGTDPRLWTEYKVTIPQFLQYTFLSQGYLPFYITDKKDATTVFIVSDATGAGATDRMSLNSGITTYRWAMKDVPSLKPESFTSNIGNHISKIEFQLSAFRYPLTDRNIMGTWPGLTANLLKSENFGAGLTASNAWLSDVVKPLIEGATTDVQKAKNIYEYLRNNITCTDHNGVYIDQTLKNVLKTRNGNVAEVNLLLTAMLRYAGLQADPVILSTTDHGYTFQLYPLIARFNYVVSRLEINGKEYMLDASRQRLGFGRLTPDCYNGHARIVNADATPINLSADSLKEKKITSMFIRNTPQGWEGTMQQAAGYYESISIRNKIKEKGADAFFSEVKKAYPIEIDIREPKVDSLDQYDQPLGMKYSFAINREDADILYVNPMFGEGYKENPFKSAVRMYPVEMPYTIDETYVLSMEIPEGYEVDELPKQVAVKLNEQGDGYFEYLVSKSNNMVSLRSRVKLQRAYYTPEEYDYMREFFMMIVNKHNEQIVFKKKK